MSKVKVKKMQIFSASLIYIDKYIFKSLAFGLDGPMRSKGGL